MYVSQEAETLAVHSYKNTEAIKRNLRNLQKRRVFAQRVTNGRGVLFDQICYYSIEVRLHHVLKFSTNHDIIMLQKKI